ncbi:MarR family transcriptional regulator [Streptomyces sp. ISL-22]|uniref:helix-turn-helix transcriptional regulator n=1 Tax=unclassified Streptomyces TaxID=2593676 RepID=UPI001BE89CC3|nr:MULTISPECIES: helix-turn-helix domain-containing protein [unclassified Streptomyces]MBT2423499.1 MarR family transcriptional regulator [Streptomyces sp. ISL-24]MBT2432508.1 MarR family transcriptional regulator [Streptomyces sp. ISL-22]
MTDDATDHQSRGWTFLTNHARVLAAIARYPNARLTQVATACQITERSAQRIVAELEEAGYLRRQRDGRRTQYTVNRDGLFRHPAEASLSIGTLLELLVGRALQDANRDSAVREDRESDGTSQ